MKIATFLPNWVGDAVMATPALRAIRDRYPRAEIVGVLRPHIGDVIANARLVDRTIAWNPRGADSTDRGWSLMQSLRNEQFDVAVLFPNSLRTAWMAWCSGAKRRIGFARNGRGLLLTDALTPRSRRQPHPVLDEYLRLAERFDCTRLSRRMELATSIDDERAWTAAASAAFRASENRLPEYVALNPGGAFGAAKHWPTEHFAELARRIAVELNRAVLVLCGPAERSIARDIVARANHPRVASLAEAAPAIGLTKAAVRHAELLVTTDSGPRHFAPPFQVPVITLFGPTHIAWSETHVEDAIHLQIPIDCGPCQQRVCPLKHHQCMTELRVEYVFASVAVRLNEARPATPVAA